MWCHLAGAALLALLLAQDGSAPAEKAYEEAVSLLAEGDASGAASAAAKAVALSNRFVPEQEIEIAPDKGLLFEDMILEARAKYRVRRERYFRTLGDALAATESFPASRKAYLRAVGMRPQADLYLHMADDPDLSIVERVDFLLSAYLAPGADRDALEKSLLETGVFKTRNALKASLDARRFPELSAEFPELELVPGTFPNIQVVTDAGTLTVAERFRLGNTLVVYAPTEGCARCSEELDGLTLPLGDARRSGALIDVAAFVADDDLPITRRIVRLLALPVGVGRREVLPPDMGFLAHGEIRIVARGGLTQIRIPTRADISTPELRRPIQGVLDFLSAPGLPVEDKLEPEQASVPLVDFPESASERRTLFDWLDRLEKLEAGPSPLDDVYSTVNRLAQDEIRAASEREFGFELLESLSRLRGMHAAKTQALELLEPHIGARLLEEAKAIDPEIRRTATGAQAAFFTRVSETTDGRKRVLLQRTYQAVDGLRYLEFVLEDDGAQLATRWAGDSPGRPAGVDAVEAGGVFFFEDEDCDGARLIDEDGVLARVCGAIVMDGELVQMRSALVDEISNGPTFFQPVRRDAAATTSDESALSRGLRLFEENDFGAAVEAFEEAESQIDPAALYDTSDLLFNRARALEESGKRIEALALYRALGDVAYQSLVDEAAGRIEGAAR